MPGRKKNPVQTAATRQTFLENAFELFVSGSIEALTMSQIAKASGFSDMTLYRYFPSKPDLVVAVAVWKWEQFQNEYLEQRPYAGAEEATAAENFQFFLESFLQLYREHRDILRFNQFFNVYVESERIETGTLSPYRNMIEGLKTRFHSMYQKAGQDGTLRTDVPEEKMFSATLHLMLAAVTRYAVGLIYDAGIDPEEELLELKDMLMQRYTA